MIFITSDWHFCHNREFIWKARNFSSVNEMNEEIIKRNNKLVKPEDDLYVLGDLLLGGEKSLEQGLNLISRINGKLHLVRGNHCTDKRWEAFSKLPNVVETKNSIYLKHQGYHFYMSHFPSLTGNNDKFLKQMTLNLFGHTHQKEHFFENSFWMYNVAMDAHDCYPCNLNDIIQEMKTQWTDNQISGAEGITPHDVFIKKDAPKPYEAWQAADAYRNRYCDRCVHYRISCGGPGLLKAECPPDIKYRRDPPDGGYYG